MTTEDDFHRHLDANPDDHHARMVFADFLDDQGDPRAAGYRALGKLRKRAFISNADVSDSTSEEPVGGWAHPNNGYVRSVWGMKKYHNNSLPVDWHNLISPPHPLEVAGGFDWRNDEAWMEGWKGRRGAEDAAAHAFAKLPPERQAELLSDSYGTAEGSVQMQRRMRARRLTRRVRS